MYDHKLISKIAPLVEVPDVENIFLLRNSPLEYNKVLSYSPPQGMNVLFLREIYKFIKAIRICRTQSVDFVCGIFLRPHGLFAHWIGKMFKKPVIQIFIGNDVDFLVNHSRVFKKLLSSSFRIGVRGSRSLHRLNELIRDEKRFFLHHNVYSVQASSGGNQTRRDIDVLCVADFSRVKRIDVFIDVVSRLREVFPSIRAVMLGGGRRGPAYRRKIRRLGLESNIKLEGQVEDVGSYMNRSRVFVLTSKAEGLPMSMVEAMSRRIPCVVPDVGDIGDIAVNTENAFVVEPLNTSQFVTNIRSLLEDEVLAERIGEAALKTIQNRDREFSLDYNTSVWEEILG
ncbi:glycosyltransferase family 4 protein [Acidobacteriota bacterium]